MTAVIPPPHLGAGNPTPIPWIRPPYVMALREDRAFEGAQGLDFGGSGSVEAVVPFRGVGDVIPDIS